MEDPDEIVIVFERDPDFKQETAEQQNSGDRQDSDTYIKNVISSAMDSGLPILDAGSGVLVSESVCLTMSSSVSLNDSVHPKQPSQLELARPLVPKEPFSATTSSQDRMNESCLSPAKPTQLQEVVLPSHPRTSTVSRDTPATTTSDFPSPTSTLVSSVDEKDINHPLAEGFNIMDAIIQKHGEKESQNFIVFESGIVTRRCRK